MQVEILTFAGCPNARAATELVEHIVSRLRTEAVVRQVDVPDLEAAEQLRFLGSPSVRVDGVDVEPGAASRREYVYACRIYRTESGVRGLPDERWIRDSVARP